MLGFNVIFGTVDEDEIKHRERGLRLRVRKFLVLQGLQNALSLIGQFGIFGHYNLEAVLRVENALEEIRGYLSQLQGRKLAQKIQLAQEPLRDADVGAKLEFHLGKLFHKFLVEAR